MPTHNQRKQGQIKKQVARKPQPAPRFDTSKHYVSKNDGKKFGKGVWYDGDGKLIKPGQGVLSEDKKWVTQYNTDGTKTVFNRQQWAAKQQRDHEVRVLQRDIKYAIPVDPNKMITLSVDKNSPTSKLRGAQISENLLDSIALNAKRENYPFSKALGLFTQESTLANGNSRYAGKNTLGWFPTLLSSYEDLRKLWPYADKAYNEGYGKYSPMLLGSYWKDTYNHPFSAYTYGSNLKPLETPRSEKFYNKGFEYSLDKANEYELKDESPIRSAIRSYKEDPTHYNANDTDYPNKVAVSTQEVMHSPEIRAYMQMNNLHAEGGYLDNSTPWNELPLSQKAAIIREAVNNGIYSLQDIRTAYSNDGHLFYLGGPAYTPSASIRKKITGWEGSSMYKAAPDTGKVNRSFEAEAKDFNRVIPASIRAKLSQDQLDALYSYGYNVGMGNLKARVLPTLTNYVNGRAGAEDVASSMWAARDSEPKMSGLRRRRAYERNQFINGSSVDTRQSIVTKALNADLSQLPATPAQPDDYTLSLLYASNPTDYGTPFNYSVPTKAVEEIVSSPVEERPNGWGLLSLIQDWSSPQQASQPLATYQPKTENQSPFVVAVPSTNNTMLDASWFADGGQMYRIQKGDTLSAIAKKNGLSLEELLKLNPQIEDVNKIWVGDTINTDKNSAAGASQLNIPFRLATEPLLSEQFNVFNNFSSPSNTSPKTRRVVNIKEEWDREDSLAGDNLAIIQAAPHNSNYVVIDKANGSLNVFDKDNSLLYQMPVNTGVSGNDYNTITYTEGGKKNGTIINGAGNNSTPAGITYISGVGQYHGVPSFTRSRSLTPNSKGESDDIASSIHYGKLDKKDTKKSNGCVRADGKSLKELQNFIAKGTPVYTLPENNTSRFTLRNNKLSFVADNPYGIDVFKAKPREEYRTQKAYENALAKEAESRKKFAKEHPDMDFDEAYKKRFWDDYNVYTDKSYSPLRIVDNEAKDGSLNFLNPMYYRNRRVYANTLSSGKKALQKDFGITSDTYNHIANVALGIAEQETQFGTADSYVLKQLIGEEGVNALKKASRFIGNKESDINSQGITQIKLDSDNQAMQEMYKRYGITKDSVKTLEGAALATMVRLLTIYKDEIVGRKFTAYDGSRISPYDALVYKWNGKNRRLNSGKADPKNNPYIQHIAESTKGFSFYEDRDVEGQSLLANNPGNDSLSRRLFAEGGSLKVNYSDWKKAIAEYNDIHVDEDNTYDYEGYYNKYPAQAWAILSDDPEAHFIDEFKTVYHPSFSNQSKYSGIIDTRFNPEGIIGGTWSEDGKRYTLSEDQARHRWDIGRTMDYFGRAENNGVEGFYPDGRHWTTVEGDPWGGVLPAVTVTPKKKARGGYLFGDGGDTDAGDDETTENAYDRFRNSTAGSVASFIPIVGTVMDGVELVRNPSWENAGWFATGLASDIFGGRLLTSALKSSAKSTLKNALRRGRNRLGLSAKQQAKTDAIMGKLVLGSIISEADNVIQYAANNSNEEELEKELKNSDVELAYDDEFGYGTYERMDPPMGLQKDYEKKYGKVEARRHFGLETVAYPGRENVNTSPTSERSELAEEGMRNIMRRHTYKNNHISNREFDMPFIPSKAIVIDGNVISTNQLDTLAKYWGWHNAYPQLSEHPSNLAKTRVLNKNEMLGLARQETAFGALPFYNMGRELGNGNGGFTDRELGNANYLKAYGSIPAEYYLRDFHYNQDGVSLSTPPYLDAFQYFAQGDYNRGDPEHTEDVNAKGAHVWTYPVINQWWQDSGKTWTERGAELGEQQKERDAAKRLVRKDSKVIIIK